MIKSNCPALYILPTDIDWRPRYPLLYAYRTYFVSNWIDVVAYKTKEAPYCTPTSGLGVSYGLYREVHLS